MKAIQHFFAAGLALLLCTNGAWAQRSIRVESGSDFSTITGQKWPGDSQFILGQDGFQAGHVPFDLNFGSGAKSYDFSFSVNGYLAFFEAPAGGAGVGVLPPAGNFIAPFASPMVTRGQTKFGLGAIDTQAPYIESEARTALRFTWFGMCPVTNDSCVDRADFQVVLIDRGAGDFDLEMNYGFFDPDAPTPFAGQQGLHLGNNVLALRNGPFTGNTSPDHYFRNGVMQTTTVPEPATYALALAGLGIVGFAARARRRA